MLSEVANMEFSAESQRRAGARVLRPWLSSARMVRLFYRIGVLAQSRPGAVDTIELVVDRAIAGRTVTAALSHARDKAVG